MAASEAVCWVFFFLQELASKNPTSVTNFEYDEGIKCVKQMILYSAITGHFIQQKRRQFANEETDVYLYRWSTCVTSISSIV